MKKNNDYFILLDKSVKAGRTKQKQNHFFMFSNFLKEILCLQKIIVYHWN